MPAELICMYQCFWMLSSRQKVQIELIHSATQYPILANMKKLPPPNQKTLLFIMVSLS